LRTIFLNLEAEVLTRVEEVAKKRGISMAQVAVAWTLSKEGELTNTIIFERIA
jgi:aryl-alcohol dehydrogenase-like predicted oxidoreductase